MTLANLVDEQELVRIALPLQGHRTLGLDATLSLEEESHFCAHFRPGQLPVDELDFGPLCNVTIEKADKLTIIKAKIEQVLSPGLLRLRSIETVTNLQNREYFRVETALMVGFRHLDEADESLTPLVPVNLSGGGIRFPINRKFHLRDKLSLKLFLEQFPQTNAHCVGQVVRIDPKKDGEMEIALRFIDINARDRDRIISYCFARQREHLRKRVKVKEGT